MTAQHTSNAVKQLCCQLAPVDGVLRVAARIVEVGFEAKCDADGMLAPIISKSTAI